MRASSGPGGKKKISGSPRRADRLKNLYTKSERFILCSRVPWAWSERVNLYGRQIMILPRKTKTCNIVRRPGPFLGRRTSVICTGFPVGTVRPCVCIHIHIYRGCQRNVYTNTVFSFLKMCIHFLAPSIYIYIYYAGHAVAQLVEALRYQPEDCGFDSRWCHWKFSLA